MSAIVESDTIPAGLNEDVVHLMSHTENEPACLIVWRLRAYRVAAASRLTRGTSSDVCHYPSLH